MKYIKLSPVYESQKMHVTSNSTSIKDSCLKQSRQSNPALERMGEIERCWSNSYRGDIPIIPAQCDSIETRSILSNTLRVFIH